MLTRLSVVVLGGTLVWANALRLFPVNRAVVGLGWIAPTALAFFFILVGRDLRFPVSRPRRGGLLVGATLLMFIVSVVRSQSVGGPAERGLLALLWLSTVGLLWITIRLSALRDAGRWEQIARWALMAPAVFVGVNLTLWIAGFRLPTQLYTELPYGRMLALLGFDVRRVVFPLSRGVNNFGVIAGLGFTVASICALVDRDRAFKVLVALPLALVSAVSIALCDSRGPLVFAAATILVVVALTRLRRPGLVRWLVLFAPLAPAILWLGLPVLADSPLLSILSRRSGDIATATGRFVFWGAGAATLLSLPPQMLVGWGQYGHVTAGVSQAWADRFTSYTTEGELMSIHNGVLQLVFDMGLIGLIAWGGLLFITVVHIERAGASLSLRALVAGTVLYTTMAASTESVFSLYFPDILIAVFLTAAVAYGALLRATLHEAPGP